MWLDSIFFGFLRKKQQQQLVNEFRSILRFQAEEEDANKKINANEFHPFFDRIN